MLLSHAIALGRTLVRPGTRNEANEDGSGCARGMALESVGERCPRFDPNRCWTNAVRFAEIWPWTTIRYVYQPDVCECLVKDPEGNILVQVDVAWTIAHIFDHHIYSTDLARRTWTLDELIDWVRSIEPKAATAAPVGQPVSTETAK